MQLAALFLFFASVAAPALAGPKQDRCDCARGSPDEAIQGCTRIIKGRRRRFRVELDFDQAIKLNPKIALAYNSRGIAYSGTGQYERAIADNDRAIKLNLKLALAFNNRGVAPFSTTRRLQVSAELNCAI